MQGKYSQTVSEAYRADQEWFVKNCHEENDIYDKDGYDSYGYNENNIDRAGNPESHYYSMDSDKFLMIEMSWCLNNGKIRIVK